MHVGLIATADLLAALKQVELSIRGDSMLKDLKQALLFAALTISTAAIAQTPAPQAPVKPGPLAQTPPAPAAAGAQATGAAATTTTTGAAMAAPLGLPAAIAGGMVAVGAASTNDNGLPTPSTSHH